MKSPYADEAYHTLTAVLDMPTVSYTESYRACCEEVAVGDAELCILPYRNASGYLSTTDALIDRYGLKQVQSCRVFHADGTNVTHFGLYGKELLGIRKGYTPTLSYSFPYAEEESLIAHLTAATALGVQPMRMLTEPNEEDAHAMHCQITASVPEKNLIPWLIYLVAFCEGYRLRGLYNEEEL